MSYNKHGDIPVVPAQFLPPEDAAATNGETPYVTIPAESISAVPAYGGPQPTHVPVVPQQQQQTIQQQQQQRQSQDNATCWTIVGGSVACTAGVCCCICCILPLVIFVVIWFAFVEGSKKLASDFNDDFNNFNDDFYNN